MAREQGDQCPISRALMARAATDEWLSASDRSINLIRSPIRVNRAGKWNVEECDMISAEAGDIQEPIICRVPEIRGGCGGDGRYRP